MTATVPARPPVDKATERQLARGEKVAERTKRRLTSRTATIAALVIALLWTLPTFGLFVSSLRPASLVNTTGWWTIFQNWGFTLDNYVEVLQSGNGTLTLAGAFVNSLAITIPATVGPLVIASDQQFYTLSVGLALLNQQIAVNPSLQMAAASIMVVPILIVFIIFQRYVIQGFALSGLK